MKYDRKLGSKRAQGIVTPKAPQNRPKPQKVITKEVDFSSVAAKSIFEKITKLFNKNDWWKK